MEDLTVRPADLLHNVIAAVEEAGELLREEFHRASGPRGSGSHAPIDAELERLLLRRLTAALPCACVAEETLPTVPCSGEVWVIDPHDGTSDFLKGRRGSAISVALVCNNRPVLGVVFAPLAPDDSGDLFAWAEGANLTRNGRVIAGTPAGGSRTIALNADAGCYALHNHSALRGLRVRALPSPAYRLALAAAGEVEVAASLVAGLALWDIAGGHALLVGAGKKLLDRQGEQIDYGRRYTDGVVGGNAETLRQVLPLELGAGTAEIRPIHLPKKKVRDPLLLSRAQGCLLGQLSGDALGSAVEFKSAVEIQEEFPNGLEELIDGGTWNLIAGQPTDDSEMALALARTLLRENGFSAEAIANAYGDWLDSRPFDCGITTRAGILALRGIGRSLPLSQSNGALMRISPVGIFAAGDPRRAADLARADAALTHPHPICLSANASFAAAISAGVAGADELEMFEAALEHAGDDGAAEVVRICLRTSRSYPPADFEINIGWVLTALQNAFYWLHRRASLEEAVTTTVGSGGDTDTNGATCGALLGARAGRDAVPLQWRNAVLTCRLVAADEIRHPRPMTYWPDDALELAEALLVCGEKNDEHV